MSRNTPPSQGSSQSRSTKSSRKRSSTRSSRATSSSKPLAHVIYPAPTAQEKNAQTTWTTTSSCPSLMNVPSMGLDLSAYISSGSHYCTPEFSMQYGTLSSKTSTIQSFLRRMGRCLTASRALSWKWELIESFGHGEKITLTMTPLIYLGSEGSSGSSSRKHQRKSLKGGRRSQGSR